MGTTLFSPGKRLLGAIVAPLCAVTSVGCAGETFSSTNGTGGSTTTTTTTSSTGGSGAGGTTTASTGGGGAGGATSTSSSGGGGTGGSTPILCQPLSDPCAQCAFNACNDQYCVCYAQDDCPALVNCIQDCAPDDLACQQPCLSAHEDAISTAFILGGCVAEPCAAECPGLLPLDACLSCMFTMCSANMNDCLADADCNAILQCAILCPPGPDQQTCAFACAEGKPSSAVNKALLTQGCRNTNCAEPCQ